jgi:hypothetical protein
MLDTARKNHPGASLEQLVLSRSPVNWGSPVPKEFKQAVTALKKDLAYLPSEYGELKINGPIRLDGSNFAGAVLSDAGVYGIPPKQLNALREIMRQRGIPLIDQNGGDLMSKARVISEQGLRRR